MPSPSETRSTILDVAQGLIQRLGVNGMSYRDISRAVGIRNASIHHHFPSKEDLVVALLERYSMEFHTTVEAILDSDLKPQTKLRRFLQLFEETIGNEAEDRACLCGMLASELLSIGDRPAGLVRAFLRDCHSALKQILGQGVETGDFRVSGRLSNCADLFLVALEGGLIVSRADGGAARFNAITRQLEQGVRRR